MSREIVPHRAGSERLFSASSPAPHVLEFVVSRAPRIPNPTGNEFLFHWTRSLIMFRLTDGWFSCSCFPSYRKCCSERPGAVKGAPVGAALRTLDGEDRSERIDERGKADPDSGSIF